VLGFRWTGSVLDELQSWFDNMFGDETETKDLTNLDIVEYEPKYKKARRHISVLRESQRQVESKIAQRHSSELLRWKEAITAAKEYFKSPHYKNWYPDDKKAAAKKIRAALVYPTFHFSRDGWDNFYSIGDLGWPRQLWKNVAWKHRQKIQNGFRQLINDNLPAEERLSAVLDSGGKYRVHGVGPNIVSRVLVVDRPKVWPVYNKPIAETLKAFEYKLTRGMSDSSKYLAFAEMMRNFMRESGAPDMLALDCFFYWYSTPR
jgi:hypothetical protein